LDDLNDFNPFVVNSSLPGRTHVFSNVTAGIHKVFIRDKNGCGLTIKDAIVIGFPHFLTPNGDGINDTWNVAGASLQPNSLIYIFDRFGKLLAKVNPTGSGWDGTFNGRKLPSNDYWFTARLQDGRIRKGHFSLVRR
ncbi:MAG: T9SS type B sorting domain-containing protein, partial [Flavobacteriales bacterium]|nr:T9SS type B sorting domain-containing protein [Flavobacteriales bacterium]